jgi:hypothetical protein
VLKFIFERKVKTEYSCPHPKNVSLVKIKISSSLAQAEYEDNQASVCFFQQIFVFDQFLAARGRLMSVIKDSFFRFPHSMSKYALFYIKGP